MVIFLTKRLDTIPTNYVNTRIRMRLNVSINVSLDLFFYSHFVAVYTVVRRQIVFDYSPTRLCIHCIAVTHYYRTASYIPSSTVYVFLFFSPQFLDTPLSVYFIHGPFVVSLKCCNTAPQVGLKNTSIFDYSPPRFCFRCITVTCSVTHIARIWINRVRLPSLHMVS